MLRPLRAVPWSLAREPFFKTNMATTLPYKISTLIFIRNAAQKLLLLQRSKPPNKDLWSPIGGKLEMAKGESPFECAIRETREEIGMRLSIQDLHLFGIVTEKAYEGRCHWLMFLFDCKRSIATLPKPCTEGHFAFFTRAEIEDLNLPTTDSQGLWPIYDHCRHGFSVLRADCQPKKPLRIAQEEQFGL